MLNGIIRLALRYRMLVVFISLMVLVYGGYVMATLPIDVLPDLDRPRVVLLTECPGYSPEDVESQVSFPLEAALNGGTGVQAVRSQSGPSISIVWVDFDWNTNIYTARQIVQERLGNVDLPDGIKPHMAPISSIMGQIMLIGLTRKDDSAQEQMELRTLADWVIRPRLLKITGVAQVVAMGGGRKQYQVLVNPDALLRFDVSLEEITEALQKNNVSGSAGWMQEGGREQPIRFIGRLGPTSKETIEQLQKIPVKSTDKRTISLAEISRIVEAPQVKRGDASVNGKPGVLMVITKQPHQDTRLLTTNVIEALEELKPSLPPDVTINSELFQLKRFIDLGVYNVAEALAIGAVLVIIVLFLFLLNFRTTFISLTAIPISLAITAIVFKAIGWFTETQLSINVMTLGGIAVAMGELVDDAIVDVENIYRRLRENRELSEPRPALTVIYEASVEIRNAIVFGTIMVILVFLPLFALSGVAGRLFAPLAVAYIISILASLLVSLTVTPVLSYLFIARKFIWPVVSFFVAGGLAALIGFWLIPFGLSYLQIEALFWIRITACVIFTPFWWGVIHLPDLFGERHGDGLLLRILKWHAAFLIRFSMANPGLLLVLTWLGVAVAGWMLTQIGSKFLPEFDEGSVQVNVGLPAGSSLQASNEACEQVDALFRKMRKSKKNPNGIILHFVRRTGRAELDEHAEPVNFSEYILSINPDIHKSRDEVIKNILDQARELHVGADVEAEQPLQHLISHMMTGVTAQIAIKINGDDLSTLHRKAEEVKAAIADVKGIAPPVVEPQQLAEELHIDPREDMLRDFHVDKQHLFEFVRTARFGTVVSQVIERERRFDLLVRLDQRHQNDYRTLNRLIVHTPKAKQKSVNLGTLADIHVGLGPNTIRRENVRRRIVVRINTQGRDVGSVVADIRELVRQKVKMPEGYFVEYGGQFQDQRRATILIVTLSGLAIVAMFVVLAVLYPSWRIVLQILNALPTAFIGGVLALVLTGQTLTVASMVGFISLGGIAVRNGILLVSHYIHLMKHENEGFTQQMIMRGSLERLSPVLMTALTAAIALLPLVIAGNEPGREVLYPVATVIFGGLITSTFCEFLIHPGLFWKFSGTDAKRLTEQP